MADRDLLIRDVEIGGRPGLDLRVRDGRIAEIGERLAPCPNDFDGCGGALLPGLIDHHAHLLASAVQAASIRLEDAADGEAIARRIRDAARDQPGSTSLRATGYHERIAGPLTRTELDSILPHRPLRVQHQTGGLWMLNSAALALVATGETPDCVERGSDGQPTGRIFRGDAWLRAQIGSTPPDVTAIGRTLARLGITGVTDASVSTDSVAAAHLANAVRSGALPVRLMLMSGGELEAPEDGAFAVGPVKILPDDHDLPPLDEVIATIAQARRWNRRVAVHCVTAGELAISLAAFGAAGSLPGDRIEHGSIIPAEAIPVLRDLGLTVVTQPGFVHERGDRYLADVPLSEQPDLYRCASLIAAGVPLAGSSDAPYAGWDPWPAIRAAATRRTRSGAQVTPAEAVTAQGALNLFLGPQSDPGAAPRALCVGAEADLCLLDCPIAEALAEPDAGRVAATFLGGRITHG
jgi:predicted amidohydrolase YtcJ